MKLKNNKKRILYKVEGSEKIGMGHVFRSFFLIQKLKKKFDIIIFTESNSTSQKFFKRKNFKVVSYKKNNQFKDFKRLVLNLKIKRFVNDSIFFDKSIYKFLKEINCKCFFLDTKDILATRNIYCINTFIEPKNSHKNNFYGLKYIITDPSLKFRTNYKLNKDIKLVLHFGGTDDRKLNLKVLEILSQIKNLKKVSVILGPALKYDYSKIYEYKKKFKFEVKIFKYPKRLNYIYNSANLAITSGGNTLFNFCSMNLINISISTNKLEIENCKKMKKFKLSNYYGYYKDFNEKNFIQFFNKVTLNKRNKRNKILFNGVNEINTIMIRSEAKNI